jgi:hypothetical protein
MGLPANVWTGHLHSKSQGVASEAKQLTYLLHGAESFLRSW